MTIHRCFPDAAVAILATALCMSIASPAFALPTAQQEQELAELSLEELMNLEVTSVSRRSERLFDTAAAVFVLTGDDLRRANVRTIPEALRLAPGVEVARIDGNKFGIAVRGFNNLFADKLLVMIDGRTVYNQIFSGVYWESYDLPMEDIERIEVVRGPGAAIWGANAVNGVVNIITKNAADTQGTYLELGTGRNSEVGTVLLRHGDTVARNFHYRVYGKYTDRDHSVLGDGDPASDAWRVSTAGFRVDWLPTDRDAIRFQGDYIDSRAGNTLNRPTFVPPFSEMVTDDTLASVAAFGMSWERALSGDSHLRVVANVERSTRESPLLDDDATNAELRIHHELRPAAGHQVQWGIDFRHTTTSVPTRELVRFDPIRRDTNVFALYAQDRIRLAPDNLWLTLGAKAERNSFTGWEFLPSARVLWHLSDANTVWAAASRAVRLPSRKDFDVTATFAIVYDPLLQLPIGAAITGPRSPLEPERLLAYEIGFRTRPSDELYVDIAAFYNDYANLVGFELRPELVSLQFVPAPHLLVPASAVNGANGRGMGFEVAASWTPVVGTRVSGSYSFLDLEVTEDRPEVLRSSISENSPRHQVKIRGDFDLSQAVRVNASLFWVSALGGEATERIDGYARFDLGLTYLLAGGVEVTAAAQNLFDSRHLEFGPTFWEIPTPSQRRGLITFGWRF